MARPPTASETSRPPAPRAQEIPPPAASTAAMASCIPVPAAPAIPIPPGRATLQKPRPTPPMCAVPQSGPMTSRFLSRPMRLSATSSCNGHIVAEDEAVEAITEGALGLAAHARAGNREKGEIDPGVFPECGVERGCGEVCERARSGACAGGGQGRFHGMASSSCAVSGASALDDEDEVVRPGAFRFFRQQAARCELLEVHRRAHEGRRFPDTREPSPRRRR